MKLIDCCGKLLRSTEGLNLPSDTEGYTLDLYENHLADIPTTYIAKFAKINMRGTPFCQKKIYFSNVFCDPITVVCINNCIKYGCVQEYIFFKKLLLIIYYISTPKQNYNNYCSQ